MACGASLSAGLSWSVSLVSRGTTMSNLVKQTLPKFRSGTECVAKVRGTRPVRNNRIQEARRLNQSCAVR
jgi:hypothetical protein